MKRLLIAWGTCCALGCSDDAGELRRISFAVEAVGTQLDGPVQTEQGWSVTLDAAELSVAAVYFRNSAPSSGTAEEQGRVVAQILGPFTIDALDSTPRALDVEGSGLTEPVRSAEVWLTEAADGPVADALGALQALAHVAGTAVRGDERIEFDGGLQVPLQSDARAFESVQGRRVRRVSAGFVLRDGGLLRFRVDPTAFPSSIIFDQLSPGGPELHDFDNDSQQVQLRSGIASPGAYSFEIN